MPPVRLDSMHTHLTQKLFQHDVTLVMADIANHCHSLLPAELELIAGMRESRIHEFCTGRVCAHQALRTLGIEDFPVLKGEQREPVWPGDVVGSISHCRDIAGAVVADRQAVKSIGLDIESRKQLNPAIARHVCTAQERDWLAQLDPAEQNLALLIIFSSKEAIFKCVYQATGERLRFQQCDVTPVLSSGNAEVAIRLPGFTLRADEIELRFVSGDTHVYSGASWVYIPAVG
jgi:4'-phosphopantetheinyl transferase EntD